MYVLPALTASLLFAVPADPANLPPPPAINPQEAARQYGKLPLRFVPNVGQFPASARFVAQGAGFRAVVKSEGVDIALHSKAASSRRVGTVSLRLKRANPKPALRGETAVIGKTHYLLGRNPARWHTNVTNWKRVRGQQVYPGIDLVFHGDGNRLEYDFVVAPGASPNAIALCFNRRARITAQGDLCLTVGGQSLRWQKPVAYQEVAGKRHPVESRYRRLRDGSIGFQVARYDPALPLVIDPTLAYSTYLGGTGDDMGHSIAVDATGCAYIAGQTSGSFPVTVGAAQTAYGGDSLDGFVTKLDPQGNVLFTTYLGGTHLDSANAIAVDASGGIYVAGQAGSGFPTTNGAFQTTCTSIFTNAFVAKLRTDGSGLVYATYLGGSGTARANAVAVDAAGNAVVAGEADAGFPTTSGGFQPTYAGGGSTSAFVAKLDANGTRLLYSTYLGGTAFTGVNALALDAGGMIYAAGSTQGAFPATAGAYQTTFGGGSSDAFALKIDPTRSGTASLVYATYLGGGGDETANGMTVTPDGGACLTGQATDSFPTTNGAIRTTYGSVSSAAFVTKFNAAGSALVFSTYLGGTEADYGFGIASDARGGLYVAGCGGRGFPTTANAAQPGFGGGSFDVWLARLTPAGTRIAYATYLGGSDDECAYALAVDASGHAYLTGAVGTAFPVTETPAQSGFGGGPGDAFASRLPTVDNDWNGDGQPDIVFQNAATGQIAFWLMNGQNVAGGGTPQYLPDTGWRLVGTGDFWRDGVPALVFQNRDTNQVAFWRMRGTQVRGGALADYVPPIGWNVVAVADMNGDGIPDLIFQHQTTRQIAYWYMHGTSVGGGAFASQTPDAGWQVVGAADFNGDGRNDLLFQHADTHRLAVWTMRDTAVLGGYLFAAAPEPGWTVAGIGDLLGEGKPAILFQNATTNRIAFWQWSGAQVTGGGLLNSVPEANWRVIQR